MTATVTFVDGSVLKSVPIAVPVKAWGYYSFCKECGIEGEIMSGPMMAGIPADLAMKFWESKCNNKESIFKEMDEWPVHSFKLAMAFAQFYADNKPSTPA